MTFEELMEENIENNSKTTFESFFDETKSADNTLLSGNVEQNDIEKQDNRNTIQQNEKQVENDEQNQNVITENSQHKQEEDENNKTQKNNSQNENYIQSGDTQNDNNEKDVSKIIISKNDLQKFENSNAYKIKLENFEGPLDLLLYLIKDSKVEIEDIKLAEVTDQYLVYMEQLNSIDMETAAEFIDIAATLLEIKSKHLLPQERIEDNLEITDEQRLLMRLKEYKLFKEASEKLKEQENVNRLYKAPDDKASDFRVILKQMNVESLINAFTKLLSRASLETAISETKTIERDRWTVEEKEFEIQTLIMQKGEMKFSQIVDKDFTRGEIITTFMALLELLKRQQIEVVQDEQFGDIKIIKGEELKGEEING